jgi:membrane protease YdiL (CAAX protease family)
LQLAGVILLLWQTCRATPADMGLTTREWGKSVRTALVLAAVLIPAVYALQALVMWLAMALGMTPEDHTFTKLARAGLSGVEWALLLFTAVVAAPLWEELMFRGLIQRWAVARRAEGGATLLLVALVVAVMTRWDAFQKAETYPDRIGAMLPALCVIALTAAWPLTRRPGAGLFATAVLFAFVHSAVWPSPIPLLLLGAGLGWLASRWPTLAGPVLLHALFNAVACVMLLLT